MSPAAFCCLHASGKVYTASSYGGIGYYGAGGERARIQEEKGLAICDDSYQAFYDGKPLELTLSEFLLLQVLKKESKRVFTREQLILRIFNEDYVGNDRIIDAHIKNLRRKTFLYSIILAGLMTTFVLGYFVLNLPKGMCCRRTFRWRLRWSKRRYREAAGQLQGAGK